VQDSSQSRFVVRRSRITSLARAITSVFRHGTWPLGHYYCHFRCTELMKLVASRSGWASSPLKNLSLSGAKTTIEPQCLRHKSIVGSRIGATLVTNSVSSGFQGRATRTILLATTWLADVATELQHSAYSLLAIPSTCRCRSCDHGLSEHGILGSP
jgi:hypothetical protein